MVVGGDSDAQNDSTVDQTFLRLGLMFNISFDELRRSVVVAGTSSADLPAYYQVQCQGCACVIGAKPATLSTQTVT